MICYNIKAKKVAPRKAPVKAKAKASNGGTGNPPNPDPRHVANWYF